MNDIIDQVSLLISIESNLPILLSFKATNHRFDDQDVMVLNDIIDQVSERPMSKATHLSSAFQVFFIITILVVFMVMPSFVDDVVLILACGGIGIGAYFGGDDDGVFVKSINSQDDDDEGPKMKDIIFDCIKKTSDVMYVLNTK